MQSTRRRTFEQQDAADERNRNLFWLWVLVACAGLAGLVGFFGNRDAAWPRPFAFGWFALFATGLVAELRRRRARAADHGPP